MPTYKINVKWQKEKFTDVECNTDETPEVFKALIFSLTGVTPNRQTIMFPGGTLKDSWSNIKLKNGITVMMMGSTNKIVDKISDSERPKFIEDMTEGQIQKELKLPQGLKNIGNTCYMNATLQSLRSIPELYQVMKCVKNFDSAEKDQITNFVYNITNLFNNMDTTTQPLNPFVVLKSLHDVCPQFASTQELPAERGGGSIFMQQDANECLTEIIRCLQKTLTLPNSIENYELSDPIKFPEGGWNFVEQFLTGKTEVTTTNTEVENEVSVTEESFLELSCFIESGLKYLHTGIRNGFEGTLTKMCDSLGRDAVYKRKSLISRLPAYLPIQFVRFYYKEKEKINAKILKDIKFPLVLDMYEFCTNKLQSKLLPMREKYKKMEDIKLDKTRLAKKSGEEARPDDTKDDARGKCYPYWFSDDIGSNNCGYYELRAVVTHQGRSSTSGHYVGWVRKSKGSSNWVKYDDDDVSFVKSEDIERLSGGGDWHCAYVLIYGPMDVEIEDGALQTAAANSNQVTTSITNANNSQNSDGAVGGDDNKME